jgi:hypothetical protein
VAKQEKKEKHARKIYKFLIDKREIQTGLDTLEHRGKSFVIVSPFPADYVITSLSRTFVHDNDNLAGSKRQPMAFDCVIG